MIRYPLAEDTIDRADMDALADWLRSYPRLTQGELTRRFEEKCAAWAGRSHAVFCNSGSSANLLMVHALLSSGRLKNKKIIVPSTGWVTSISPAIQLGLEPVMCESDPETFGLELNCLEDLLQKHRASAVMLVQVLGVPHKMREMLELKDRYGFFLLEDACAAVGSAAEGRKLGGFGDLASFSFYFGHQASTIEGGAVLTDDEDLYRLALMLRGHGWSKDLDAEAHRALVEKFGIDDFHRPFVFYEAGYNLRSSDLNAFIGLRQIEKLDRAAVRRHQNHMVYREKLGGHFMVQKWRDPGARIASIHFAVVAEGPEPRRAILSSLAEQGVETRIFSAAHLGLHPFWYGRYGKPVCPVAEKIYRGGFFLPNHPSLKAEEAAAISQMVLDAASSPKLGVL